LAQGLELIVAVDHRQSGRARRVRIYGQGAPQSVIMVRADPRPERLQWSIAHEVGEHLAQRVFQLLGNRGPEPPGIREDVANHLASRLLLPRAWFECAARVHDWDLIELKRDFTTASHELIARRMLDFAPPIIVTVFDQGRQTFRRANAIGPTPPPSRHEIACWRSVHDNNRPGRYPVDQPCIFGWPIHEPGWQREILRTLITDG
jgi:hypothetical protein